MKLFFDPVGPTKATSNPAWPGPSWCFELLGLRPPDANGPVPTTRGDLLAVRGHRHAVHRRIPAEDLLDRPGFNFDPPGRPVGAPGDQVRTLGAKGARPDVALVDAEGLHHLRRVDVPDSNRVVPAARREIPSLRIEGQGIDGAGVSGQRRLRRAVLRVPELDRLVAPGGREQFAVLVKGNRRDDAAIVSDPRADRLPGCRVPNGDRPVPGPAGE